MLFPYDVHMFAERQNRVTPQEGGRQYLLTPTSHGPAS